MLRCGLIINPVAGVGGEAGLAGSDGADIQRLALERGVRKRSAERAERALAGILRLVPDLEVVTGSGELGAASCSRLGIPHTVVHEAAEPTTAGDTTALAAALRDAVVDVLLFAGGDGTARDVTAAVGDAVLCVGIPAGVKMHSAVFALTPDDVGPVVAAVAGGTAQRELAEVVDIDEAARRAGLLGSRLYGQLLVPKLPRAMQRGKRSIGAADLGWLAGVAEVVAARSAGDPLLLGPGTTVRDLAAVWGLEASLLGVDLLEDGELTTDLDAVALEHAVGDRRFRLLVSPVGGQGIVLGRGNQQLNRVLDRLRPEDLIVVCSPEKLAALGGRPLIVDAPTPALNAKFAGPHRILTGATDEAIYPIR